MTDNTEGGDFLILNFGDRIKILMTSLSPTPQTSKFRLNTCHQHRWTPIWVNLHNLVYCIWNMMSKILKFNIRLWSQRGPLCTFELDEHICGDSLWDPIVGSLGSMHFSRFSSSWPFSLDPWCMWLCDIDSF